VLGAFNMLLVQQVPSGLQLQPCTLQQRICLCAMHSILATQRGAGQRRSCYGLQANRFIGYFDYDERPGYTVQLSGSTCESWRPIHLQALQLDERHP
jgi:hypothetical protein